jgi:hypothetical protein
VERKSAYYFFNVAVIVFMLVLMAATTVAIDIENFNDRSSITLTLLLTLVAFKITVSSQIPFVNYQTYLDMYLLLSFALIVLVMCENFTVCIGFQHHPDLEFWERLDWIFMTVFVALWLFLNSLIASASKLSVFHPSWQTVENNDPMDKSEQLSVDRSEERSKASLLKRNWLAMTASMRKREANKPSPNSVFPIPIPFGREM